MLRCHNVAKTLWKVRNIYNVVTMLFHNVVCTLQPNVEVYVVATLLVCNSHNVAKLQGCINWEALCSL